MEIMLGSQRHRRSASIIEKFFVHVRLLEQVCGTPLLSESISEFSLHGSADFRWERSPHPSADSSDALQFAHVRKPGVEEEFVGGPEREGARGVGRAWRKLRCRYGLAACGAFLLCSGLGM